jgi:hypothetical protein
MGDALEEGTYIVHSSFRNVVNFVKRDDPTSVPLVSVVTEEIGAGSVNIVCSGFDASDIKALRISQQGVRINNRQIDIGRSQRYSSKIEIPQHAAKCLEQQRAFCETALVQSAPRKSLAFLLDDQRRDDFRSGFEQAVAEKLWMGVSELFHGDFFGGVHLMKGVGFGLTPSGDDFLVGLLLGLWVIQQVYQQEMSVVQDQVYQIAKSQNLLSNTFLYCAKEGLLFERWKAFLLLLFFAEEDAIRAALQRVLSMGETSGADAAVGFLLTLKNIRFATKARR